MQFSVALNAAADEDKTADAAGGHAHGVALVASAALPAAGVCFRRQVVLQGYIADFYACSARLIVEVDGPWHAHRGSRDAHRARVLRAAGYRVLRVTAEEVQQALPVVSARIRHVLLEK